MTALGLMNNFFDDAFDSVFNNLSKIHSFPFYNVVKYGKGKYGVELGLAGYSKKDVSVEVKDGILIISGQVDDSEKEYITKGLSFRKFYKQFSIRNDVIVDEAEMKDGILTVKLGFKEPKKAEGTKINIK
jgi:molecular chaperone IbpA|tara:strand:- start:1220 stop:1609 length:390 start_codon:yes stop_codon:yes gene_type:complete